MSQPVTRRNLARSRRPVAAERAGLDRGLEIVAEGVVELRDASDRVLEALLDVHARALGRRAALAGASTETRGARELVDEGGLLALEARGAARIAGLLG